MFEGFSHTASPRTPVNKGRKWAGVATLRPSRCHALRQALLRSSRSILSTGHTIIITAMTFRRRAGPLGSVTKPTPITYVVLLTTVSLSETALGVGRMGPPRWLRFVERLFPSSNMVVIAGDKPVLVNTGYGSDLARTEGLLAERGIGPADLSLVVNTHHHSDHVDGNAGLQGRHGAPVAAHRWEAEMVNSRDPEACSARWLDQPYRVDVPLSEGDEIDAGGVRLEVLHTPGHTLGHLSLWEPEERVLILGDAAHADDVAWINPYREGAGAIGRAMESVERLAGLKARWACSGHGPAVVEPERALAAVRERYEGEARVGRLARLQADRGLRPDDPRRAGRGRGDRLLRLPPVGGRLRAPRLRRRPAGVRPGPDRAAPRFGGGAAGGWWPAPRTTGPRTTGNPPIPGPETGRLLKRRRNGPTGAVTRISETTRKEKDEQARGPADRGVFRRARGR